jgi:hypothetical protein
LIYICIPTHNEQQTVGVVLWKLRQVLTEYPRDYQLLVADDASSDKTQDVLEPYTRVLPLTVIRTERQQGHAACLEMLLREATRRSEYPKRDVIVTLQADFSEEPDDVVALLRRMEAGADVAAGRKVSAAREPALRRFARKLSGFFARRQEWPEGEVTPFEGYRAYRLYAVKRAMEERGSERLLRYDGWAGHAELLRAVLPHARRVDVVDVEDRGDRRQRASRERPLAAAMQVRAMMRDAAPAELVSVEELDRLAATASSARERAAAGNGNGRRAQQAGNGRDGRSRERARPEGRSREARGEGRGRPDAAGRSEGRSRGEGRSGPTARGGAETEPGQRRERTPRKRTERGERPARQPRAAGADETASDATVLPDQEQPQLAGGTAAGAVAGPVSGAEDRVVDGAADSAVDGAPAGDAGAAPRKRRRRRRGRGGRGGAEAQAEGPDGVRHDADGSGDGAADGAGDADTPRGDGDSDGDGNGDGEAQAERKRRRRGGRRGGRGRRRRSGAGPEGSGEGAGDGETFSEDGGGSGGSTAGDAAADAGQGGPPEGGGPHQERPVSSAETTASPPERTPQE